MHRFLFHNLLKKKKIEGYCHMNNLLMLLNIGFMAQRSIF